VDGPGEPRSLAERLFRLLNSSEERGLSQARGPAAELRGRLEQALSGLQALNDPRGVYARMSYDLNLR
jgi:hypothetical protein